MKSFVVRQLRGANEVIEQIEEFTMEVSCDDAATINIHLISLRISTSIIKAFRNLLMAGSNNQWLSIKISSCSLCSEIHFHTSDIVDLGSLLATRSHSLTCEESPSILECILNTRRFQCSQLYVQQHVGLKALECLRLGVLIQKSSSLRKISLKATPLCEPNLLLMKVASAFHLESITFWDIRNLAKFLLCTNGALQGLLSNHASKLRILNLQKVDIQDFHMGRLCKLLRWPKYSLENESTKESDVKVYQGLEVLDVSHNRIGNDGIMQFARYLNELQSLKKVTLSPNPWNSRDKLCDEALLKGLRKNMSLEYLHSLANISEASELIFCLHLNRAGRRILYRSCHVPDALWSKVLSRALFLGDSESSKLMGASMIFYFLCNNPTIAMN